MSIRESASADRGAEARAWERSRCAFCDGTALRPIIDFGEMALAGGFLREEHFAGEPKFRLRLVFCEACAAVQVPDIVDPKALFQNYFYFSSAIRMLRDHFADYALEVSSRFLDPASATVVEIGCNDGVLLRPFAEQGVRTLIGVDPAANVLETITDPRIRKVNDFFSRPVAESIASDHGRADLIVANNVYAHIPDIRGVTEAVRDLLKDDGVFVLEVHYLGKVIEGLQYDMVYHEHLYYYSLLSLEEHFRRCGMKVFDVKPIPIHAGSMRYYVCKESSARARSISGRVEALRREERDKGYDRAETYGRFARDVAARKERLMDVVERLRRKGRRICGYGASGRANTIIQYCGLGREHVEYMVDDAPAKEGFFTPGSHLPIRARSALLEDAPDYVLVFAWGYLNEISDRCREYLERGGRLITPLPDVKVILVPTGDDQL